MIDLGEIILHVPMQPAHIPDPAAEYAPVLCIYAFFNDAQPLLRFPQLLLQQHQLFGFLHVVELVNGPVNRQAVALPFQGADQTVDPEEESFDPLVMR